MDRAGWTQANDAHPLLADKDPERQHRQERRRNFSQEHGKWQDVSEVLLKARHTGGGMSFFDFFSFAAIGWRFFVPRCLGPINLLFLIIRFASNSGSDLPADEHNDNGG